MLSQPVTPCSEGVRGDFFQKIVLVGHRNRATQCTPDFIAGLVSLDQELSIESLHSPRAFIHQEIQGFKGRPDPPKNGFFANNSRVLKPVTSDGQWNRDKSLYKLPVKICWRTELWIKSYGRFSGPETPPKPKMHIFGPSSGSMQDPVPKTLWIGARST